MSGGATPPGGVRFPRDALLMMAASAGLSHARSGDTHSLVGGDEQFDRLARRVARDEPDDLREQIGLVLRDAMAYYPGDSRMVPDYAVAVAVWLARRE